MTVEAENNMAGRGFKTLVDQDKMNMLQKTCQQIGSKFEVKLKPGDKCFGSDGKAIYNNGPSGVTGRFVKTIGKNPLKPDETTWVKADPKTITMPENTYWVEYTIGIGGYSEFWKTFDALMPIHPIPEVEL